MVYPESLEVAAKRYSDFFNLTKMNQKARIAIMVCHGQSIPSFMELCEPDASSKDIFGIGYCCLSIVKVNKFGLCEKICLADATHSGCGTSEIYLREPND